MKEHLELEITERFGELERKAKEGESKLPKDEAVKHKNIVILSALKVATTRIVLAKNVGELSKQVKEMAVDLKVGKDAAEVDGLRAAVMMKIGEVVDSDLLASSQARVENLLKTGDVAGAVNWLEQLAKKDEYKLEPKKQKEVDDLLNAVTELNNDTGVDPKVAEKKAENVFDMSKDLGKSVDKEIAEIKVTSEEVESEVLRKYVEGETVKPPVKTRIAAGKVESTPVEVKEMTKQAETAIVGDDRAIEDDKKFVSKILNAGGKGFGKVDSAGNLALEVDKFKYIDAQLLYARTSIVLGRHRVELAKSENKELHDYLENLQFELRERLMEIEGENKEKKIARGLTPVDEDIDPRVLETLRRNSEFQRQYARGEDLAEHAREGGMNRSRSEGNIRKLIAESNGKYKEDEHFRFEGEDTFWIGEAEDFYELCRQEINKIKDSVPEERLGNLVFEEKAQLYLALMGVSAKGRPDIRQAKDAVTKTLYMEFALKSLWKAGGNHEAWQRAGGLLLREEAETNFFMTMNIREKIRGTVDGRSVELPGFNVNDIMTMGELDAPNGQSWLAYISTDNIELNKGRLKEYVGAMAENSFDKAKLLYEKKLKDPKLTPQEVSTIKDKFAKDSENIKLIKEEGFEFDDEQMDFIRNYTHYMHTATMNVGEKLWLMDATTPGEKGSFDYASLPGGQFAEKSGLHGVLYFAKYGVTKYGYEALGKIFVPNHSMLSYARGETLRHFLTDKGNEAWLKDADGKATNIGRGGARDFFFRFEEKPVRDKSGNVKKDVDGNEIMDIGEADKDAIKSFINFWSEIWLDEKTGKGFKNKGMRAIKHARDKGRALFDSKKFTVKIKGKDVEFSTTQFVEKMDFSKMEAKLGYEIPGENNEEKLGWMVDNVSYEMMEVGTMPSKREADWLNKYSKYMTETDTALQAFLDAPTLANKMKVIESVLRYNSGAVDDMSTMMDDFVNENRKTNWRGPTVIDKDEAGNAILQKDSTGNIMVGQHQESPFKGWYPGRGLFFTRQALKEGTNDPMVMRKMEIRNAIAWGIVPPEVGGQMMRDWQKDIYFGEKIGNTNFRLGYTGILTPFLLARGWWVDRMGLNWEDFMMILGKQNEETLGKIMKLLGAS